MNMTKEEKDSVRAQVNAAAVQGAQKAAEAAKKATGWKKWLWAALAAVLAGLALFTQTQCSAVTPGQVQAMHGVYHVVTGEPCIFVVDSDK